jgi:hypothetical protein
MFYTLVARAFMSLNALNINIAVGNGTRPMSGIVAHMLAWPVFHIL